MGGKKMENLNILDKERVQNRLKEYFDTFREEKINGVPFNIMPPREEVPLVKQVSYNREKDIFEIVFEYKSTVRVNQQGNVAFIEDTQGRLVGIQVNAVQKNGVKKITLEIISTIDKIIQAARVQLENNPDPKNVAIADLEERKGDFFKGIVENEMPSLVA